jgi:hypothetical protein
MLQSTTNIRGYGPVLLLPTNCQLILPNISVVIHWVLTSVICWVLTSFIRWVLNGMGHEIPMQIQPDIEVYLAFTIGSMSACDTDLWTWWELHLVIQEP